MARRFIPSEAKARARLLRKEGKTHREIAKILSVSTSTAHLWTRELSISVEQKQAIQSRRHQHQWTAEDRAAVKKRMQAFQFKKKYTPESLVKKICDFYKANGRIPLKREFNSWHPYATHFGSWNKAIEAAGFNTNPVLFSKRLVAEDGHTCDSFTEKIIDDWLFAHHVAHERSVVYKNTRFTADFKVNTILIEFFGLAGVQKDYDKNIQRKRALAKSHGLTLIELYPEDIYPENKLASILKTAGVI